MGERNGGRVPDEHSSLEEAIQSASSSPPVDYRGGRTTKPPARASTEPSLLQQHQAPIPPPPPAATVVVSSDLHAAAQENDVQLMARVIAQRDVDINARDELGRTALWFASLEGHAEIVKLLLEQQTHELDVYSVDDYYGFNSLHLAASWGHTDVVKQLLVYERKIHSCRLLLAPVSGNSWFTSLHLAVDNDHPQIVYELKVACLWATIEGSEDVYEQVFNATDSEGNTALHIAAQKSTLPVTSELLKWEQGDLNIYGNNGFTPLHLACFRKDPRIVARLLEDPRIDVNAATKFHPSSTPLHLAAMENSSELVRALSTHSALMPNMRDFDGVMPLQIAAEGGDDSVVSLLLRLPDVQQYVSKMHTDRQAYVNASSAMLVAAAIISSLSFSGWLQPPLGYADHRESLSFAALDQDISVRVFWVLNSLSFFCSVTTVMSAIAALLPGSEAFIGKAVSSCYGWLRRTSRLLAFSALFVLGSFMAAGFASLPPNVHYEAIMMATGSVGIVAILILLCFVRGRMRKPRYRPPPEKTYDTYSMSSPTPSRRSSFKLIDHSSVYPSVQATQWPADVDDLTRKLDQLKALS